MNGLRGIGIKGLSNPVFSATCPGGGLFSSIMSLSPQLYFPMDELSGVVAVNYGSLGAVANGTYSGPVLAQVAAPGGTLAPYFDGSDDYLKFYSAAYAAAFSAAEGSLGVYYQMYANSVWTDATAERYFASILSVSSQAINVSKPASSYIQGVYNTTRFVQIAGQSGTSWNHLLVTWSQSANEVKVYKNGLQIGATKTFLAGFATPFASSSLFGRARSDIAGKVHYGYLCHGTYFTRALTSEEVSLFGNF